ncbi:hypothetical protein D1822_11555 [Phaeobacter inhibens]|nr:hypothetical protein D1822_11555 [Phaeobacter inhibens]
MYHIGFDQTWPPDTGMDHTGRNNLKLGRLETDHDWRWTSSVSHVPKLTEHGRMTCCMTAPIRLNGQKIGRTNVDGNR